MIIGIRRYKSEGGDWEGGKERRQDCGNRKREWQPGQCPKPVFHLLKKREKEKIIDCRFYQHFSKQSI